MTSEPTPPASAVPAGDPHVRGTADDGRAANEDLRPETGAEGSAWPFWQVVVGVLGWVVGALGIWYFARAATPLAWKLLALFVVVALVLGLGSSVFSIAVLRPRLVALRDQPLELEHPQPLDHDALGRPVVATEGAFRQAGGELVAVVTPEGRRFLPPDKAAPYLEATEASHE